MSEENKPSRVKLAAVSGFSQAGVAVMNMFISFFTRAIFIFYLGMNVFGINALLSEFLGMLTLVELGFGGAADFALYQALGKKDLQMQRALLSLYKKVYLTVGIVILVVGLIALYFLPSILKDAINTPHIYEIYLIMLGNTCFGYLLRGKKPLLAADQRQYVYAYNSFLFTMIPVLIQIFLVWKFHSFFIYTIVGAVFGFASNIWLYIIAERLYKHLDDIEKTKLPKETSSNIIRNVVACFVGNILTKIALSADNTIISIFIGVSFVGVYSNYMLVSNACACIFIMMIHAIQPGMGQALQNWNQKTMEISLHRMFAIRSCFATLFAGPAVFVVGSFMFAWLGPSSIFSSNIPVFAAIIMWLGLAFGLPKDFVYITGNQWRTQWITILFMALNVGLTLFFIGYVKMGISGTLLAGILTTSLGAEICFMKFGFKHIFKTSIKPYINGFLKAIFLQVISFTLLFLILTPLTAPIPELAWIIGVKEPIVQIPFADLFINSAFSLTLPALILFIGYRETEAFEYAVGLAKKAINEFKDKTIMNGITTK